MIMIDLLKSFKISFVSFRAVRGLLFPKSVSWFGLFFAISYSKAALGFKKDMTETLDQELDFLNEMLLTYKVFMIIVKSGWFDNSKERK